MGVGVEALQVGRFNKEKSKGKHKVVEGNGTKGCWMKFRFMRRCRTPKTETKYITGVINTLCEEGKSTNGTIHTQAVTPCALSSTTSQTESALSTPIAPEELIVASQLRRFTFNELKSAAKNFKRENLLGEGGFGCVYKGWISETGTCPTKPGIGIPVAVKNLNNDGLQGHKEWMAEVIFLGELLHPNLVKLVGYGIEDDKRLLVYEFMPRGSLENHLFRRTLPLPWSIRMKIALGAAKGLAFLHEESERPVIFRDFKTSNILLDAHYNPKLSDFGLALDGPEGDNTHVSTRVMGTYGYAAPEYVMTGHLTSKSDVYSFGVVLLELLIGRRSIDKSRPQREQSLVEWACPHLRHKQRYFQLIDPRLEGRFSVTGAETAFQLAANCLSRNPKARPRMSEVVQVIKSLLHLKDYACSSSHHQGVHIGRPGSSPGSRNCHFSQGGVTRNGQPTRSGSLPNGPNVSPYRISHPHRSPKPSPAKSKKTSLKSPKPATA